MIDRGVIKSTLPVKIELERQRDELVDFFTSFTNLFVEPTLKEQRYVVQLVNNEYLSRWGRGSSTKHYADPYVVALAKAYDLKVVTYETGTNRNTVGRACEILELEIYKFSEFLRQEGFSFD
jgi:hypothetical protein